MTESACQYVTPWRGKCKDAAIESDPALCEEHAGEECVVCGDAAVTECDRTVISLMCGAPLCDKHDTKKCPRHD